MNENTKMTIACLDLEGVLVPEIWIAFSEKTNLPELRLTTRDEPDYDKLMHYRMDILKRNGLGLNEISVFGEGITPEWVLNLMPMTEAALASAGLRITDLDAVAAVTGPGSFTGVRIGVATAKGLAHGAGIPCIAVDALEALSVSAGRFDGVVCPIQDARAGQVYGAAFRNGVRLTDDAPMKLEEFLETVSSLGERFLFTGDGAPVFRERIREILGEKAEFAPAHMGYLRPSAAGSIAMARGTMTDYLHLEATYLRPPNAQKNRKLLEAVNEFYTEEGSRMAQYGLEGEEFRINSDGTWEWIDDLSTVAQYILPTHTIGTGAVAPGIALEDFQLRYGDAPTQRNIEMMDSVNAFSVLPYPYVYLSDADAAEIARIHGDLSAYAEHAMACFVTGDLELNDANWETFCRTVHEKGLDDEIAIWQKYVTNGD